MPRRPLSTAEGWASRWPRPRFASCVALLAVAAASFALGATVARLGIASRMLPAATWTSAVATAPLRGAAGLPVDDDPTASSTLTEEGGSGPAAKELPPTTPTGPLGLRPDAGLALFNASAPLTPAEERSRYWSSQFGEDRFVYKTFFRGMRSGVFVEIGALDGTRFSNTRFLQHEMGWRGLLMEPSRRNYAALRANPRCAFNATCLNVAVCDRWGTVSFLDAAAVGGISDVLHANLERHFSKFEDLKRATAHDAICGPMGDLVKIAGLERVDFFSLDVEGAELLAVRTMDWKAVPVHVLVIENRLRDDGKQSDAINRVLLESGFKFYAKQGRDKCVAARERGASRWELDD